jgi:hypothetical protein
MTSLMFFYYSAVPPIVLCVILISGTVIVDQGSPVVKWSKGCALTESIWV